MKKRRLIGKMITINAIVGLSLFALMLPFSAVLPRTGLSDAAVDSVLLSMFGGTMVLGVVDLVLVLAGFEPSKFRDPNLVPSVLPIPFSSFAAVQAHLDRSFAASNYSEKTQRLYDGKVEAALYASDSPYEKWTSVVLLHLPVLDEDSLQHGWEMAKSLLEIWLEDNPRSAPILALICADRTALPAKRLNKGFLLTYEKSEATPVILKLDQQQVHMAILPAKESLHTGMMKFSLHLLGIDKNKNASKKR